ncbi:MAG: DUF456 domain-containing protein [Candidatus Pacebacteria bacterium]|nr:DUF456 domain-containing protein [Candidatus Paceibacterota bacterium]
MTIFLIIVSFILALVGLLGIILPVIPSAPLAWAGMLLFAYATGFAEVTVAIILIFLGLTILSIIFDVVAPMLGAKKYKAGKSGLAGSFLGTIFGVMLFGPIGLAIGPLFGAFLGEWISGKTAETSFQSAMGSAFGILLSGIIKFSLIATIIGFMVAAIL